VNVEREVRDHAIAERHQREDHEQRIDAVEEERHVLEEPLDRRVAERRDENDAADEAQRTDERRPADERVADRTGGGAEHRQDEHDEQEVRRFEDDPARPEEVAEEGAVIAALRGAREQERRDAHDAPHHHGQQHREDSTPWPAGQEELNELAASCIAATDHDRLEGKAREQVTLKPGGCGTHRGCRSGTKDAADTQWAAKR
jgi:hypothetical protein